MLGAAHLAERESAAGRSAAASAAAAGCLGLRARAGRDSACEWHRSQGDATAEHTLEEAGLNRAHAVVACVNSDADNVLLTLTSKGLQPGITVVARAKADENESKLRRAGADRVILPSSIGARRIASLITRPTVADFLEGLGVGGADLTLEEVPVEEGGELDGLELRETQIRERFGVTVLAVRSDAGMDTHPSPNLTLHGGDVLVVLGGEDDIRAFAGDLNLKRVRRTDVNRGRAP